MDKLKIFISWSGERSRLVAEVFRDWLPDVLPFTRAWMSSKDIGKGANWEREFDRGLDMAEIGLICLTPENLNSPWILFEAGALSRETSRDYVCTYLHGLRGEDLAPPLSRFQFTEATQEDIRKLVMRINQACREGVMPEDQCNRAFDRCWAELLHKLAAIDLAFRERERPRVRSDREIIEEILSLVREKVVASQPNPL